jgi:hypothetical protein
LSFGSGNARFYLLDVFLAIWWNILGKKGFFMLFLGIGKEFLHYLCCFFLFQGKFCLNPWRSIRAYTLHQDLSFIVLNNLIFAKVARGVKGLTPSQVNSAN